MYGSEVLGEVREQDIGILHLWCYFTEDVDKIVFDGKEYDLREYPDEFVKLSEDVERKILEWLDDRVGNVLAVDHSTYHTEEEDLVSSDILLDFRYPFNGMRGALVDDLKEIEEEINKIVPFPIRCRVGVKFPSRDTLEWAEEELE